ncbi:hypothetical protein [Microbulbifer sp. VAAF005]|uniref:hypothetical protein n=1 Tax=Microbulbifer sp. VAAF005 TaxID=3034230 RepID=UPI0024ADA65B|nr:hypothetical protein [Microbulbifer sp. VAAF005]WHI49004.1 hypothetical protein P0078_11825 [Microbulbifer sp. VAAF005]
MKLLRSLLFIVLALMVISALAAPGFIGPKVEEIWKQQLGRLQGEFHGLRTRMVWC